MRVNFQSDICQLEKQKTGEMKLRINIPEDYSANYLILLLKLKARRNFVGPTLMLMAKIITKRSSDVEQSAFDDVDDECSSYSMDTVKRKIKAGNDVYSDQ